MNEYKKIRFIHGMKDTGREREKFFSTKKNKKSPYTTQYIVTYIRCFF